MLPDRPIPERKVPVIVKRGYVVYLERTSGLTFVHCDIIGRWSASVKSSLVRDWRSFRNLHEAPILALHDPGDHKHHKFLKLFGFQFVSAFNDASTGDEKHLFIHSGA